MDDSQNMADPAQTEAPQGGAHPKARPRFSIFDQRVKRRNSREWAVQMLFALDSFPLETSLDEFFADFWEMQRLPFPGEPDGPGAPPAPSQAETRANQIDSKSAGKYRSFAEQLVSCVMRHRDEIDLKILNYAQNWTLPRMRGVDRNVLRLAFCELFFLNDTPPAIIINEAVDIARYFGLNDSASFVNGILDSAAKDVPRPMHYKAGRQPASRS